MLFQLCGGFLHGVLHRKPIKFGFAVLQVVIQCNHQAKGVVAELLLDDDLDKHLWRPGGGGGVLGWVEWRVKEEGGKQLKDDGYLAFESE